MTETEDDPYKDPVAIARLETALADCCRELYGTGHYEEMPRAIGPKHGLVIEQVVQVDRHQRPALWLERTDKCFREVQTDLENLRAQVLALQEANDGLQHTIGGLRKEMRVLELREVATDYPEIDLIDPEDYDERLN